MRLSFRLKSLFVLIFLLSCLLATIAFQMKRRREFFHWKETLESEHNEIRLENHFDGTQNSSWSLPQVTSITLHDWTIENEDAWILGISKLGRVDDLTVIRGEFGMRSLQKFERLSPPDWLALYNVEPDALVGLPDSFRSIKCLNFVDPNPGEVKLDRIGELQGLTKLSLDEIRFSTECKWLENLHELRCLTAIGSTEVSNLIPFVRSPGLSELIAFNSDFLDSDAKVVASLPNLRFASLGRTRMTDEGVQHFKGHPHIQFFFCGNTAVTDESLAVFASMPNLKELHLNGTEVTEEGFKEFKAHFPDVRVAIDYEDSWEPTGLGF
ncbi:hypothetical protein AB1K70_24680 [Bremerella sp. JC770]|uniref:hypothetical protein n=1 Tax=Bremerella sp. JC770 TaxID=3232137 RepID=UPI00345A044E